MGWSEGTDPHDAGGTGARGSGGKAPGPAVSDQQHGIQEGPPGRRRDAAPDGNPGGGLRGREGDPDEYPDRDGDRGRCRDGSRVRSGPVGLVLDGGMVVRMVRAAGGKLRGVIAAVRMGVVRMTLDLMAVGHGDQSGGVAAVVQVAERASLDQRQADRHRKEGDHQTLDDRTHPARDTAVRPEFNPFVGTGLFPSGLEAEQGLRSACQVRPAPRLVRCWPG